MLDGQPAAAAIAPDGANVAQHGGRPTHSGAAGLQAPAPNTVPPPEDTAYMVDLHRPVFNAKLQEYMASKAKNVTILFESEYAQALECLRIYDNLEEEGSPYCEKIRTSHSWRGSSIGQVLVKRSPLLVCYDPAVDAQQLDQHADERRDTLQAAAAPAELGAAGANEWGSNAKTEVAHILVVLCGSSQGQAPSFRSGCGVLSDLVALSGEAYKAVVRPPGRDGSSGGLSLGALRLGGGNVEAGGVASQEEIAECTCSGGNTCQGVNVDAKDGMRLAEVLRRRRRGLHHWLVVRIPIPSVDRSKPQKMLGVHRHRGE
eukprot:jgi/Tetstr1/460848/TSEL_006008.t1